MLLPKFCFRGVFAWRSVTVLVITSGLFFLYRNSQFSPLPALLHYRTLLQKQADIEQNQGRFVSDLMSRVIPLDNKRDKKYLKESFLSDPPARGNPSGNGVDVKEKQDTFLQIKSPPRAPSNGDGDAKKNDISLLPKSSHRKKPDQKQNNKSSLPRNNTSRKGEPGLRDDSSEKTIKVKPPTQLSASQKGPVIPSKRPEVRQLVFSKVHKAASTTMQNIFMRFALVRNLNVLLHDKKTSLNEHSHTIERNRIISPSDGKKTFDVLCSHVIYDEKEISKYISEEAVRIAIVRQPLSQAVSALKYYYTIYDPSGALVEGYERHKNDPINSFIEHPQDFYDESMGPAYSYINNRMSVDLGFELEHFEQSKRNRTKIKEFLQTIDRQFDLVLVSEYFDESLVLMKRTLGWSLKDIVYLKVNVGEKQPNQAWHAKPILNPSIIRKFREWAEIDYQLYEHFLSIFLKTIKKETSFQEELKAFRTIQVNVKQFCLAGKTNETLRIPINSWTNTFTISRYDCELMSMNEIHLTGLARSRQIERFEESKIR